MIYDFNLPSLIRRFSPRWFRHAPNLQFAHVLLSGLSRIHALFLQWRTDEILDQYRFNGLVHSLEWVLNDRYDQPQRRIYITVEPQLPVYYHLGPQEPAIVHHLVEGFDSGYYHLTPGQSVTNYYYEFIVHVPGDITFNVPSMFDLLDLYRYAGRRPALRIFAVDDSTIELIYYPGISPVANGPIQIDPQILAAVL